MKGFNPSFGQEAAKNYGNSPRGDEDETVRFLAQFIDVEWMELDRVGFDVNRYDPVTQVLDENHVEISADGIRFGPIRQRPTYPSEFDFMARIAGLRLRERWGGWNGEPFAASSTRHVSVYESAA